MGKSYSGIWQSCTKCSWASSLRTQGKQSLAGVRGITDDVPWLAHTTLPCYVLGGGREVPMMGASRASSFSTGSAGAAVPASPVMWCAPPETWCCGPPPQPWRWSPMAGLVLPEADNYLFGLIHVQDQVLLPAPVHQLLRLMETMQWLPLMRPTTGAGTLARW